MNAVAEVIRIITKTLNEYEQVSGIFLDMWRTFDCVNFKLLLHMLNAYGIRCNTSNWLWSYLVADIM